MPTFSRVRRKRGPALNWAPTEDKYYELAQLLRSDARTPLYLTQAAILECEAHLSEASSPLPFGLLSGVACLCPETGLEYLLIDTVCRAHTELEAEDPYAQLAGELELLTTAQAKEGKLAIGWYLGGMAGDLTLDDDVARVHQALFPERWRVVLLRGRDGGVDRGAFLRYQDLWSRWFSIPFFEFLAEHGARGSDQHATAIRWANYRTDAPTRPLEESEAAARRAHLEISSGGKTRGFGGALEPLRRAVRGLAAHAPDRTPTSAASSRQALPNIRSATAEAQAATPHSDALATPHSTKPLELTSSPRRAPDTLRVPLDDRNAGKRSEQPVGTRPEPPAGRLAEQTAAVRLDQPVVIRVEQAVDAPLKERSTAPVEPRATAAGDPTLVAPVEHSAGGAAERRRVNLPELKLEPAAEPAAEPAVVARVESKAAPPVGQQVAAPVVQEVGPPREAKAAREAPRSEVQHIFIDGSLVQAPLAYELPESPGLLQRPDGVRISSIVAGVMLVLLLMLLVLYAITLR